MKRRRRFKLPSLQRDERRYLLGLGAVLALFSAGYVSYQLWLIYSPDMNRAMAWLGGAHDLGTSKLKQPIIRQASFPKIAVQQRGLAAAVDEAVSGLQLDTLPVSGEAVEIQFAGVDLASNTAITNYLLLNVKEQLLKAQAQSVRFAYPSGLKG